MENDSKMFVADKLEELDEQLRAFDTVMEFAGIGAEDNSGGDVILNLINHVRGMITDIRAGLDEIGCAVVRSSR